MYVPVLLFVLTGLDEDCWSCLVLAWMYVCVLCGSMGVTNRFALLLAHFRKARWYCIYEASITFSATDTLPPSYKQTPEKATSYNYSLT